MREEPLLRSAGKVLLALAFGLMPLAQAQPWVSFETHTRYMALGDSISAGYAAMPATQGFVYQLYQGGAIDKINDTLFCAAGVPGALSKDVLDYQVPQVGRFFTNTGMPYRKVVTLTLGGNDLLKVLYEGADPAIVIAGVGANLFQILGQLATQFPDARIYVANYYDPGLPVPGGDQLVAALNEVIGGVVAAFPNAVLVDLHSAFDGRSGLLLNEKKGSGAFEVHPTNAGYRVITRAFEDAIGRN